jgi:sterol desaturase/sphingolipid hydroxylase (fatty acid hydroxylase superfamily)
MFENPVLDAFTRVPWWGVPLVWGPLLGALAWAGLSGQALPGVPGWLTPSSAAAPASFIGWALLGVLCWTLAEYLFHRFVFHWVPDVSWGPRVHFFAHGVHHDWPDDRWRLVMPPVVSLVLGAAFHALARLLLGDRGIPWFVGFAGGYVVYDLTHYAIHHVRGPVPRWFARIRAHHLRHHFRDPTRGFGVTSALWDRVFGTAAEPGPVAERARRG